MTPPDSGEPCVDCKDPGTPHSVPHPICGNLTLILCYSCAIRRRGGKK